MPIYEFRCSKCEDLFELLIMGGDDAVEMRCPKCGSEDFTRVLSTTSYSMGAESGTPGPQSNTRSCPSGSCTTWDLPGYSR